MKKNEEIKLLNELKDGIILLNQIEKQEKTLDQIQDKIQNSMHKIIQNKKNIAYNEHIVEGTEVTKKGVIPGIVVSTLSFVVTILLSFKDPAFALALALCGAISTGVTLHNIISGLKYWKGKKQAQEELNRKPEIEKENEKEKKKIREYQKQYIEEGKKLIEMRNLQNEVIKDISSTYTEIKQLNSIYDINKEETVAEELHSQSTSNKRLRKTKNTNSKY